jgi:hypothetical protein
MRFNPMAVMQMGFAALAKEQHWNGQWTPSRLKTFNEHYGSCPVVLSRMWNDILSTRADLSKSDRTVKGFRKFLMAHHFVWAYPKNTELLVSHFKHIGTKDAYGKELWRWIGMLADLKKIKIVWHEELDDPNRPIFIVSVDGTDFKVWEKKHPYFSLDKGQYSHKFNHGALKYEIAIDVWTSRVVWINGPVRAAIHDRVLFDSGLASKIKKGKLVIADRVYGSEGRPASRKKFALPNDADDKELANFKARARCRHETFNGRLKNYKALSDTYHHNPDKHVLIFEAVCVTVQYQMDNGSKLFDV